MEKEDYMDPQCPFCVDNYKSEAPVHTINVAQAVAKIDEFLHKNDYVGAERVLRYWIGEAEAGHDDRGLLSLKNEEMGLMRKLGRCEEALAAAEKAMSLVEKIGFQETLTAGTTYVNSATVYKAFGRAAEAIPIFERACQIYEKAAYDGEMEPGDMRLGSLYNNMALALVDLDRFDEALASYEKALAVMGKAHDGAQEQAITYLNMCDLLVAQYGAVVTDDYAHVISYDDPECEKRIGEYVARARELINEPGLTRDGYHAFICEKCAPGFEFYGDSETAHQLAERAEKIYKG